MISNMRAGSEASTACGTLAASARSCLASPHGPVPPIVSPRVPSSSSNERVEWCRVLAGLLPAIERKKCEIAAAVLRAHGWRYVLGRADKRVQFERSEEHTSELQSQSNL